jgi:tetratricopeptide (TPR) repeat protein
MKKHVITAFFALLATVSFAQSNFGKDYFGIGEYDKAKAYFETQVTTSPAESNYYLGEIAYALGNMQDAASYFEKGIAADMLYPMNYIGKGKILLKTNQKEAELIFATTLKKAKKNAEVNVGIARAYYQAGLKNLVPAKLDIARKVAKKSPLLYIFEGDMLAAEQKYGDAAGKYEQAVYFDPSNTVATIKCAEVYESINPALAVEKLKTVVAAHTDYTIANRNLGRAYNANGMYKNAIESFVTYYGEGNCAYEDIYRLASAYYFTDQFPQSIVLLDKGLERDSMNFVLNRLRMYNAAKTKDVANGMPIATRFFGMVGNTFIDKDYAAYATILADAGKFTEALEQYNKVISANAAKPETFKELATLYTKMSDYAKAAETSQKYIEMVGGIDVAEGADYYSMGRSWYNAGQALRNDSTETAKALAKDYLIKADTAFGVVSVKSPESHISYLWRGHTNAALDPNTSQGLAKPHYEKALALILKKVENGANIANYKKDLINIYKYEAWYYFDLMKDKDNTILYCNKILELDPSNADAKALIDSYNPPAPKPAKGTKVKKAASTATAVAPAQPVTGPQAK